jgi:hypothetical protein
MRNFSGIPILFLRLQKPELRKYTFNTGGFYEKEIINFNVYGHIISGVFTGRGYFGDNCRSCGRCKNLSPTDNRTGRTA